MSPPPVLIKERAHSKPVEIHPYNPANRAYMVTQHAGKHLFEYSPKRDVYTYGSRIPFTTTASKHTRLNDLLADYAVFLSALICFRWRHEIDPESREYIQTVARREIQQYRGKWPFSPGALRALELDLYKYCPCKLCCGLPYYEYFKDKTGMLKYENVLEMFDLLMDEECAEIRGKWDKVFAAHVIGTAGVADIVDWTNFEEEWKRRDDEECAWKWLWEGEYRDLVVVYVPEGGEGKGVRLLDGVESGKMEADAGEENYHGMVTRRKQRKQRKQVIPELN
jgi:hypothetical protein